MSHTNLVLGANWPSDEWPESVDVMHDGVGDRLKYVPERTCKAIDDFVIPGQVQTYPYKICSNCHSDFPRLACSGDFSVENYCPNCGAKVVEEVDDAD